MKLVLLCVLLTVTKIQAAELTVNPQNIYVVSSFADRDFFTVYSHSGDLIWEIPLNAQVISWESQEDRLFVLLKAHSGLAYFLICLHAANGELQWERTIFAPNSE